MIGGDFWILTVKIVADILLYVVLAYAAMLALVLVPEDTGRVIVFVSKNQDVTNIYPVLERMEGALVEVVGDHTFVVEGNRAGFVDELYKAGALLVLSSKGVYGCDAAAARGVKRRLQYKEFAGE